MGLFDNINLNSPKTPDSSLDFRLLDTACDHLVKNEDTSSVAVPEAYRFDISELFSDNVYSGTSSTYNDLNYSSDINPDATEDVKTQYTFLNDGSLTLFENVVTDVTSKIEEVITVPTDTAEEIHLKYPPKTNSLTAKQKVYVNETDYRLVTFTRYTLSQLHGIITFSNDEDIGEEIIFYYLSDKKKIHPKNKDETKNYEFIGLDENGKGIIRVYGRAFQSNQSNLIITYKTLASNCPKCGGLEVLNDILFDENGRVQTVNDFSKLIQDFFKRLLTERGSNPLDNNDGTSIPDLIGAAKGDGIVLDELIKSEVVNLLFLVRGKQNVQRDIQGLSLGEQVAQINSISVRAISPTEIYVQIDVTSRSGQTSQLIQKVRS